MACRRMPSRRRAFAVMAAATGLTRRESRRVRASEPHGNIITHTAIGAARNKTHRSAAFAWAEVRAKRIVASLTRPAASIGPAKRAVARLINCRKMTYSPQFFRPQSRITGMALLGDKSWPCFKGFLEQRRVDDIECQTSTAIFCCASKAAHTTECQC